MEIVSSMERMVGVNSLKNIVAKIFQTDFEVFETKLRACFKEKDNIIQTLLQEAEDRETKLIEVRKTLERERQLFQKIALDSEKKDKVIYTLEQTIRENNHTNSKTEKEISILITMIREEKARVTFLSRDKGQEDQEIADIRLSLDARVTLVNGDCAPYAELETNVTNDNNDDALTEEIDLNESLEMEKLLEDIEYEGDKDKDNCLVEEDADIQETEEEIICTANTVSNVNDTVLGQSSDNKYDASELNSSSIDKEHTPQRDSKTEWSSTDNELYRKGPPRKKLKVKNIEQIPLSANISQKKVRCYNERSSFNKGT